MSLEPNQSVLDLMHARSLGELQRTGIRQPPLTIEQVTRIGLEYVKLSLRLEQNWFSGGQSPESTLMGASLYFNKFKTELMPYINLLMAIRKRRAVFWSKLNVEFTERQRYKSGRMSEQGKRWYERDCLAKKEREIRYKERFRQQQKALAST